MPSCKCSDGSVIVRYSARSSLKWVSVFRIGLRSPPKDDMVSSLASWVSSSKVATSDNLMQITT
uniref:Uncharacterized protein n=1 Tax=Babesia bovis TaxID=5865 RepID=S6BI63_BABBO|nr:hypothetical protein [Babesia bovis]